INGFGWLVCILCAGVVFPNTRRRAAVIVLALAAVPVAIDAAFAVTGPPRLGDLAFASLLTGVMLLFAVTLSLFGSAKLEALRREVSAARREARAAQAL